MFKSWSRLLIVGLLLVISGCAAYAAKQLDELYGLAEPRERLVNVDSAEAKHFHNNVQPIIEKRCVVCHGCYDAPCQLKMSSPAGINRGASKALVYDGARLRASELTRLFEDSRTTEGWREKGFYPVLNEREQDQQTNTEASILYRMLQLKKQHPLPDVAVLDDSFDFSLNRDQQCPRDDEWQGFAKKFPQWGMPYGLPGIHAKESAVLEDWLRDGAKMAKKPRLDEAYFDRIDRWERFLNGDSLKEQLVARYIYEHWFLAHLYFSDMPPGENFRLVRSSTPPGQPLKRISTRRPYDDPGVERVYYRFWREQGTILAKTHMPYALDDARLKHLKQLFLKADFEVTELPSYEPEVASNPFIAFEVIPVASRWRFILEESRFTIMNFIKGPVCRGQLALNVINDHFWVVFVSPNEEDKPKSEAFLAEQKDHLRMPVQAESNALPLSTWLKYSKSQEKYLEAKTAFLNKYADRDFLTLDLIWDGDGHNENAAITVFRHFDSASVVHGLVGQPPKTAWLVDYSLLERIHYLLVAGFDVYGNLGHQMSTRLYMDFLRMEGEWNFLALLPADARTKVRDEWYEGASKSTKNYIYGKRTEFHRPTGINFITGDQKIELFKLIKQRLAPVLHRDYDLDKTLMPAAQWQPLHRLDLHKGLSVSLLPQIAFLTVKGENDERYYYTVLHNNDHSNITSMLGENSNRRPERDTLTVVRGFIGAYPGAFWEVSEAGLPGLVSAIQGLKSEQDYHNFMSRYGVRRTDRRFWVHSDTVHQAFNNLYPRDAGLFDYNRLENR